MTTRSRAPSTGSDGTCVIYVRISLDKAGEELGIERQERECRAVAARNGWTVTQVYRDNDVSATSGVLRPEFERLLRDEPRRVVTWATDRFVRLMDDLQRVIRTGMTVHAVTAGPLDLSNPNAVAFAQVMTAMAELEGRQKSLRMQSQQRQRRGAGSPWWTVRPFGFVRDGRVVTHHPQESARIRSAYNDLAAGATYVAISKAWNEEGVTTTKGMPWTPKAVRQLLVSPRNAALMVENGEVVGHASWEPIIEAEEWRALMRRIGSPEYRDRGQGYRKGLLSGIVVCARCDAEGQRAPLQIRNTSSKRQGPRKIYGTTCGHASAPIEWLDDFVSKALLRRLASPAQALAQGPARPNDESTAAAVHEAERLRQRLDEMADMLADGDMDRAEYARARARVTTRLDELGPLEQQHYMRGPLDDYTGPKSLIDAWNSQDFAPDARRSAISAATRKVLIKTRRRGERMSAEAVQIIWAGWPTLSAPREK